MIRRGFALIVLLPLLLGACASLSGEREFSVQQLQSMGEKFIGAGDTGNALKYLTQAEKKRPSDPTIQYDLGLAYDRRGLKDEALSHFRKAISLKPDYPEAQNAIGALYAELGQVELAQESFQKALANPFYQTPEYPAYNLAALYERKGDIERALLMYQQAVKLNSNYGQAYYKTGVMLESLHRGDEARRAYAKAVAASPDLAEAHLRNGIMSYQAGDLEPALFSLSRVIKLAPGTTMAEEAKLYLDRLSSLSKTSAAPRRSSTPPPKALPGEFEVISGPEIQQQRASIQPPPSSSELPPQALAARPQMPPPPPLTPPGPAVQPQLRPAPMEPQPPAQQPEPLAQTPPRQPEPQPQLQAAMQPQTPLVEPQPVAPPQPPQPAAIEPLPAPPVEPVQSTPAGPAPEEPQLRAAEQPQPESSGLASLREQPPEIKPPAAEPPAPAPTEAPGPSQGKQASLAPAAPFNYIVQLGSFLDKQNADELRNRLKEKGYDPLVKSVKHEVLGRIYVIQLKPVPSLSKATTLMTQLASEAQGEPIIIKVPAGN